MSNKITPLKAIRGWCLDCSGFQPKEVRLCTHLHCPLYSYRFGHNPARKGVGRGQTVFNSKTTIESSKTEQNTPLNEGSNA